MSGIPESVVRLSRGLTVRLLMMLSLALVPLGTFAVFQNDRARTEASRSEETSLLSLTFASVSGELAMIRSALGSADALGSTVLESVEASEECAQTLQEFVERAGLFRFAGFADQTGQLVCSSQEPTWSFAQTGLYEALRDGDGPVIMPGPVEGADTRPPLVIASSVMQGSELQGYIIFVLAQFSLEFVREYGQPSRPTSTIFFTNDGTRISAQPDDVDLAAALPADQGLSSFATGSRRVLRAENAAGEPRTYAAVPLVEDRLFVLGVWAPEDLPSHDPPPASSTLGFALLVWLVSLGVAYYGAHRLVIRHLRTLRRQMRRFGEGNRDETPAVLENAPDEISELSRAFRTLTETLSQDEAQLEASLGEKTLLLREVHHRVKNNLQLIASIISIQGRQVENEQSRALLRGLHERVMTLAAIHENLYKLDRVTALRADTLLGDVIRRMVSISALPGSNIEVNTDLRPVTLDPDQIVPLSLLATEAMTNALKYVASSEDGASRIDIRLHESADREVCLEVINTCGAARARSDDTEKGGQIGMHLIRAFGAQLESEADQGFVETDAGRSFRVSLRFRNESAGDAPKAPAT